VRADTRRHYRLLIATRCHADYYAMPPLMPPPLIAIAIALMPCHADYLPPPFRR